MKKILTRQRPDRKEVKKEFLATVMLVSTCILTAF